MPIDALSKITGTAKSVQQVLANSRFGLDFYQREYDWGSMQVAELLDDLTTRFRDDFDDSHERSSVASYRPYFLGPIVTSQRENIRYLVDGQQRLTTLTLLLIHLYRCLEDTLDQATLHPLIHSTQYGKTSFNIAVDEREKCMSAILYGTDFDPEGQPDSVRNIWHRYQEIVERFPEELESDPLPFFSDWLLNRVILVEITAPDQDMALEIFETMNDRGLRLSNTDMLKSFLLARSGDESTIERLNSLWRDRITELTDAEKNADAEFVKAWLRGDYAESIRERKSKASPGDFDIIGTAFHKWVRDNTDKLGLNKSADFERFVDHEFARLSSRYLDLIDATHNYTCGLESVYHLRCTGFTLHLPLILSAITSDDDEATFHAKANLVAKALDIYLVRRMVNYRNFGYSSVVYTMFNLMKTIRDRSVDELPQLLIDWLATEEEGIEGLKHLRLTQRNGSHIRYLLARITSWIEIETNQTDNFCEYMHRFPDPFEVEHIWANHFERHLDEFSSETEFQEYRNRVGDLVLLPKSFNASYCDSPYDKKVRLYIKHNILVRSLHPDAYENDPSFRKLIDDHSLAFRSYPKRFSDGESVEFPKEAILERQDLYLSVAQIIWDPGILEPATESPE